MRRLPAKSGRGRARRERIADLGLAAASPRRLTEHDPFGSRHRNRSICKPRGYLDVPPKPPRRVDEVIA
jgi:hypothetical protein